MKILLIEIGKIVAVVVISISIVYVGLRVVAGSPEATRQGFASSPQTSEAPSSTAERLIVAARHYPSWIKSALLLDFGRSSYVNSNPFALIRAQIGRTLALAAAAFALSLVVAIIGAALSARWPQSFTSRLLALGARIAITIPEFWLGLILLFLFAIYLPLFPLFGATSVRHYILPCAALIISRSAVLFYLLRGKIIADEEQEYILSAKIRALPRWRVISHYQIRTAITILIPIAVIQFGYLFAGAVIIERVFGISGFGTLLLQALQRRDYAVVEASVFLIAIIFALLGVLADVARLSANPQLQKGG